MIYQAKDLSPDQKLTIERLVSRSISDRDAISIRVLQPPLGASLERRREVLDLMNAYFTQIDN